MSQWPVVIAAAIGATPGTVTTLVGWRQHKDDSRTSRREQLREAGRDLLSEPQIVIYESNHLRLAQGRGDSDANASSIAKLDKFIVHLTAAKPRLDLLLDGESREETLVAVSNLIGACAAVAGTRYSTRAFFDQAQAEAMEKAK